MISPGVAVRLVAALIIVLTLQAHAQDPGPGRALSTKPASPGDDPDRGRMPEYCDRFDRSLTPGQVAEAEALRTQLAELSDEERSSQKGSQLSRSYLEVLDRLGDSTEERIPLECQVFAALPADQTAPSTVVQLIYLTDRAQQPRRTAHEEIDFGPSRLPQGVGTGTVQASLSYGGRCGSSGTERTWIRSTEKSISQMLEPATTFGVKPADMNAIEGDLRKFREAARQPRRVHALVFVHGFRVSFREAVVSAAEIANCMQADVVPIVLSWPSAGKMNSYLEDEESVGASRERLRDSFKWLLTRPEIDEVSVVAHSMGTRLVVRILADLHLAEMRLPKLSRVVLAAADFGEEEFSEYWSRIRNVPSGGWTFYVSNSDLALWASAAAHRRPRIGDSRTRVYALDGGDTVNALVVSPFQSLGHSYIVDNPQVVRDVRRWLVDHQEPVARGLYRHIAQPVNYWDLPR